VVGTVLNASAAFSCGYHNAVDVARGLLNWTYPKALYVRTAVWQAENAGILPKRKTTEARDLFAYQRTVAHLQTLGARLGRGVSNESTPSFAVVLVDSVLWSRFKPSGHGYEVEVHTSGPQEGDVVDVTDGKVIGALAEGTLDAHRAEEYGLVRFYGPVALKEKVRRALVALHPSDFSRRDDNIGHS
jgi:hypothetical protein